MAKLTQKHLAELTAIMAEIDRAIGYIQNDNVSICSRKMRATTTLDFSRQPIPEALQTETSRRLGHYALTEVNKDIGSNIMGLYEAKRRLQSILA
jgi:hypothetical protein